MSFTKRRLAIALFAIVIFLITGCRSETVTKAPASPPATAISSALKPGRTINPTATLTPTPEPSPTATETPKPTSTPSPTFTPTPTAIPAEVSGDLRAARLGTPSPTGNAPCGVVDLLDFPIDPPDAESITSGGYDFGVYRSRYGLYHAGEDWWRYRGQANFGEPVYSIGHGLITYAEPNGWGRDQGVVIIRHTFSDNSTILSFYGHLDPPSIVLSAGQCVTRGQQIGQIGRPRTPPHLHFEIREHMPYETGGGYWAEDPTTAGWKAPSQFIWDYRNASSPGVQWTRPVANGGAKGIGAFDEDTTAIIEDSQLLAIDIADGSVRWSYPISTTVNSAMFDQYEPVIYTANQQGELNVFAYSETQDGEVAAPSEPLWTFDSGTSASPTLMPLPGGGVIFSIRRTMVAFSADGAMLWSDNSVAVPRDWTLWEDLLIFSSAGSSGSIYSIDESGPTTWRALLNGRPVILGDRLLLYDENGLFWLDLESDSVELFYELPESYGGLGDLIILPDGGLLLAHRDIFDQRLITFNSDGSLRWQRSYTGLVEGDVHFLQLDGRVYLVSKENSSSGSELAIFAIDLEQAELTHIFTGGSRSYIPSSPGIVAAGDNLILLNFGPTVAGFDPQLAIEAVTVGTNSP